LDEVKPTKASRRKREKMQEFLKVHGFTDVSEPRLGTGCLFRTETVYPIHVACEMGDSSMVRLLLASGAEPNQKTSKGRTPMDFAAKSDLAQRHKILELLQNQGPVSSLREAMQIMTPGQMP